MATISTRSAFCTLNICRIAAPVHAHSVFTYPLNSDSHPSEEGFTLPLDLKGGYRHE